jgi:hypothetical protein
MKQDNIKIIKTLYPKIACIVLSIMILQLYGIPRKDVREHYQEIIQAFIGECYYNKEEYNILPLPINKKVK